MVIMGMGMWVASHGWGEHHMDVGAISHPTPAYLGQTLLYQLLCKILWLITSIGIFDLCKKAIVAVNTLENQADVTIEYQRFGQCTCSKRPFLWCHVAWIVCVYGCVHASLFKNTPSQ